MSAVFRHVVRCLIAGVVALLPIAGVVFTVVYLEITIAGTGIDRLGFYVPGMGLLAVVLLLYLIGLVVGTVVGRWVWNLFDKLFSRLPILGNLYQTLKQILGYGEGEGALFERVVLVPYLETDVVELGLVTNTIESAEAGKQLLVFIPACPNPMAGRLIVIEAERVHPVNMRVNEAMQAIVALGKAGVKNLQPQMAELTQAVAARKKELTG